MAGIINKIRKLIIDENGASAVEYAALLALIIAVCIVVINVLGEKVVNSYDSVNSKFNGN